MYTKILLASTLATTSLALGLRPNLAARQFDDDSTWDEDQVSDECLQSLESFVDSIPEPPTKLLEDLATNTAFLGPVDPSNPCDVDWPASVTSDVKEYGSSVLAWLSDSDVSSLFEQCPIASAYGYVTECASEWAGVGAVATTTSAITATVTATETQTTNGAPNTDESTVTTGTTLPATTSPPDENNTSTGSSDDAATTTTDDAEGGAAKESGMAMLALAAAGLVVVMS